MTPALRLVLAFAMVCAAGCTERQAIERGLALFHAPDLSPSASNVVACSDCHATNEDDTRILAGHSLVDATRRSVYFGGGETDLRRSINYCLQRFMRAPARETLAESDPRGLDLVAYLETLRSERSDAEVTDLPWALSERVAPLPVGDVLRGAGVYARGCERCHGEKVTGAGRIGPLASTLPTATIAEHGEESYLVFLQKVRWGQFRGFGGDMPPFSVERLSDADLADLAAYVGLFPPEE